MPPFLALSFSYSTDYYGVPVINSYRMESLAAMWTLLRLHKVVFLVRDEVLQQYTNKRLIESNTKIRIHSVFATKLLMENDPVKCVTFISVVFCFSAGYWLKVVEGGINSRFESYIDCMWCLVITFWTIGYGDLFPTTLLGRFVAVITGFLGIVTAAIITATLANIMQFSVKEFFVKSSLDREVYDKRSAPNPLLLLLCNEHGVSCFHGRLFAFYNAITQVHHSGGAFSTETLASVQVQQPLLLPLTAVARRHASMGWFPPSRFSRPPFVFRHLLRVCQF
jgi:hypothetical protein